LSTIDFTREKLEAVLRSDAESLGLKAGQMFQPVRVAVCGQKAAPPLFETLEVIGKETSLQRIRQAIEKLQQLNE
jgi:glutamyl-tRNA synthetase